MLADVARLARLQALDDRDLEAGLHRRHRARPGGRPTARQVGSSAARFQAAPARDDDCCVRPVCSSFACPALTVAEDDEQARRVRLLSQQRSCLGAPVRPSARCSLGRPATVRRAANRTSDALLHRGTRDSTGDSAPASALARVTMTPAPRYDCWSSSIPVASGGAKRCARTAPFPRSTSLPLRLVVVRRRSMPGVRVECRNRERESGTRQLARSIQSWVRHSSASGRLSQ
jgi:hypothetical protein